ncbi:MAG: hypothetical protein KDA81_15020, partial [Planctomycetaceae bacterium]|nr:hypothetical protein [Planctomycetaceae bacterium]
MKNRRPSAKGRENISAFDIRAPEIIVSFSRCAVLIFAAAGVLCFPGQVRGQNSGAAAPTAEVTVQSEADARRAKPDTAELDGTVRAGGVARFLSGRWGSVRGSVKNRSDHPQSMLMVVTPPGPDNLQFARSVTVPPGSVYSVQWPLLLPLNNAGNLEFTYQMFPGGTDDGVLRRRKGEPGLPSYNAIVDERDSGLVGLIWSPRFETLPEDQRLVLDDAPNQLLLALAGEGQRPGVQSVMLSDLSEFPENLDVFDLLGVTSRDLSLYPEVCRSIRLWVQRGGKLVIFLDEIGPHNAECLLDGTASLTVIDETSSNTVRLQLSPDFHVRMDQEREVIREFDEPVRITRVIADGVRPLWMVDGYPVVMHVPFGGGDVIVTAIAPQTLYEPNPNSRSPATQNRLIPSSTKLIDLTLHSNAIVRLPTEVLRTQAAEYVGYAIPGRWLAAAITLLFPLIVFLAGRRLLKRQTGELILVALPLIALLIALPTVGFGLRSRTVAPQTVVRTELLQSVPGANALASDGTLAVYNPDPAEMQISGGPLSLLIPERSQYGGDLRRINWMDDGDSQWQRFEMSAGVHLNQTRQVRMLAEPLHASATFDAQGLTGRIHSRSLGTPENAILASALPEQMAVHIAADGRFRVAPADMLEPGTFVTDSLVTEVQNRRSQLLSSVLNPAISNGRFPETPSLLYWTTSEDTPVAVDNPGTRQSLSVLVVQPIQLTAPAEGQPITIPPAMLPYRQVVDESGNMSGYSVSQKAWAQRKPAGTGRVRHAIPDVCQPFAADDSELTLRIHAPSRTVEILAGTDQKMHPVKTLTSPVGTFQIPLPASVLSDVTESGAVFVEVKASDVETSADADSQDLSSDFWHVEQLLLTLHGRRIKTVTADTKAASGLQPGNVAAMAHRSPDDAPLTGNAVKHSPAAKTSATEVVRLLRSPRSPNSYESGYYESRYGNASGGDQGQTPAP